MKNLDLSCFVRRHKSASLMKPPSLLLEIAVTGFRFGYVSEKIIYSILRM